MKHNDCDAKKNACFGDNSLCMQYFQRSLENFQNVKDGEFLHTAVDFNGYNLSDSLPRYSPK